MKIQYGLGNNIHTMLAEVFAQFTNIKQVVLYGSRARGDYHEGSDIDLAVIAPDMPDPDFTRLWDAIDNLPLIYKVDLLHYDRCQNLKLIENINKDGVSFYKP